MRKNYFQTDIKCAACGGDNLHHYEVQAYARDREDSEYGKTVLLSPHGVFASSHDDLCNDLPNNGNPSPRRDGVRILLNCESCEDITEFTLIQHKGITYTATHVYKEE